jgi:hypothetical protein
MTNPGIQVLLQPLPGQRLVEGAEPEDGSILAYRKDGDEGLFASWDVDHSKPMVWIPVGEFSPDPEAIRPPEIDETAQEQPEEPTETPVEHGPFGRGRGRSKRPSSE